MTDLYAPLGFPELQFEDNEGVILALGKVYTYAADGVTPKVTYDGPNGSANSNPVNLDNYGRGVFWGDGNYVFTVKDSTGVTIYSKPITTANAQLGISEAMFPVVRANTTAEALSLLGGVSSVPEPDTPTTIPIGAAMLWFTSTIPTGWLACYGQNISRTTYSALFALWGTTFGAGDGSTTFGVPDLRSRVPVGQEDPSTGGTGRITSAVSGLDPSTVGATGGNQLIGAHTHPITDPGHSHNLNSGITSGINAVDVYTGGGYRGFGSITGDQFTPQPSPGTSTSTTGITNTGTNASAGSSANIQPSFVLNYIVYTGV